MYCSLKWRKGRPEGIAVERGQGGEEEEGEDEEVEEIAIRRKESRRIKMRLKMAKKRKEEWEQAIQMSDLINIIVK